MNKLFESFDSSENEKLFVNKLEHDHMILLELYKEMTQYECPCKRSNTKTHKEYENETKHITHKVWSLIHKCTFEYFENPSRSLQDVVFYFFANEVRRIPCKVCMRHYTKYVLDCDFRDVCSSRDKLSRWLVDLHNEINVRNEKPIIPYEDVNF